ncbi:MAG: amidinotransferase [Chitinophagaceae bacterium]|nr:amidinotransferase [Oligoflexus sp.]
MYRPLEVNDPVSSAMDYPKQAMGRKVFMMNPLHFDVVHAINPHMVNIDGTLNTIDKERAREQWTSLKTVYEDLGFAIDVLNSEPGCPDIVFCANQFFPFLDEAGKPSVVMSNMANDGRQKEVEPIARQLRERGVNCHYLPARDSSTYFEATGDALWVPGRKLICGGYGSRTKREIYKTLEVLTGTPIITFELVNPRFYHLDTCLSILNDETVLASRDGFHPQDWEKLKGLFTHVIEVPITEADAPGFACNAHSPDGKHVVLQHGNHETCTRLKAIGLIPIEVETDEFIKSGGSVFCMKLQSLWA